MYAAAPSAESATPGAAPSDPFVDGFTTPPRAARPRIWWQWLDGNITEAGIRADLDWMTRIGLGGVQLFDIRMGAPAIVERPLAYWGRQWHQAFTLAMAEARRHGLETTIAASPGWSETGGPWVGAEDAMKKLVWRATDIDGGRPYVGMVPRPPDTTGPFQDRPWRRSALSHATRPAAADTYRDVALLAFPIGRASPLTPVRVTTAGGAELAIAPLGDGRYDASQPIDAGTAARPGHVLIQFAAPVAVRTLSLSFAGLSDPYEDAPIVPLLQASGDGRNFRDIATLALDHAPQATASFAAVTARTFRILFRHRTSTGPRSYRERMAGLAIPPDAPAVQTLDLAELAFSSESRVDRFEVKAGFGVATDYGAMDLPADGADGVDPRTVVDLTSRLRADGRLDWTPPAGRWRLLRMGWSLTGTTNHPADTEATGLEVDKYDAAAVGRYLQHYLDNYVAKPGGPLPFDALLTDSIEVGAANWTPSLREVFQSRRGYDPRPWLPALTGTIVGDRRRSDAFLYDYRATLAELIAQNHYGKIAEIAHARGLRVYGEALEVRRPSLGDDMAMRASADVPMAANWARHDKLRQPP